MRWLSRNIILVCILDISKSFFFPASLDGKRILMNGPNTGMESSNEETIFDGNGFITSVVFKNETIVISEVMIPKSGSLTFPLSDFLERDYFNLLSKMVYSFLVRKDIQSGTRNTIVLKYKDSYYATEETCRPLKLYYDNNEQIKILCKSKSIERMGAHMVEENTIISYKSLDKYPIRINNTNSIPWTPKKYPVMVHDGIKTKDNKYYIFPITSTGVGKLEDYLKRKIKIPFDSKLNKAGWVIYNIDNNNCTEIWMDEYADLFHVAHVEDIGNNMYKIYSPFIYNFTEWLSDKEHNLGIFLKEVTIDMNEMKIDKAYNTNLSMDFINEYEGYLIGTAITTEPKAIFYNMKNKQSNTLSLPGEVIREIIPYNGMLLYFSHERNLTETFLYIVKMSDGDVLSKIRIPNRPPGMHTTMY